jgi:isopentenyldiphosphate isomerase
MFPARKAHLHTKNKVHSVVPVFIRNVQQNIAIAIQKRANEQTHWVDCSQENLSVEPIMDVSVNSVGITAYLQHMPSICPSTC